jgi:transcriptional regulator with XRE-family HTH domain
MNEDDLYEHVGLAALSIPNAWSRTPPGERLRVMRRREGLSQRHLAEKAGVDSSIIGDLERGADGRLSTWNRLFDVFGYQAVFLPLSVTEEGEDLLRQEIEERRERMEAGRAARWLIGG